MHKRNQKGASLVEYGILVALIAVVSIAAVRTVGQTTSEELGCAAEAIGGSGACAGNAGSGGPYF